MRDEASPILSQAVWGEGWAVARGEGPPGAAIPRGSARLAGVGRPWPASCLSNAFPEMDLKAAVAL